MARQSGRWTRREFSAGFAGIVSTSHFAFSASDNPQADAFSGFAYVGSTPAEDIGKLHVFRTTETSWKLLQTIDASSPGHIERHPDLPVLYVVHSLSLWENLPRGAVSAYSITPSTGLLRLLNSQALSLSATTPLQAVATHDGNHLIVASATGGSYNVFPIAEDGSLRPLASVRKEIGISENLVTKIAHPQCLVRHPNGAIVLTADAGNESIHSFSVEDGALQLRHRLRVHTGAGPSQLVLSQDGAWAYSMNAVEGSIMVHRLDSLTGQLSEASQFIPSMEPERRVMAMHPSGRFLISAGSASSAPGFVTRKIDSHSGCLKLAEATPQHEACRAITFSADGRFMISIGSHSGRVLQSIFDPNSGRTGHPTTVHQIDTPSCLSLHSD